MTDRPVSGGPVSGDTELEIDRDDAIVRVRFNRPTHRNALSNAMVRQLVRTFEEAAIDDTVRAIAISSVGDNFCSGADWVATNTAGAPRPRVGHLHRRTAFEAHRLVQLIQTIEVPVVCTVRGWAAGLGCHLALAADFTIASRTARFWEPFGRRGFTPDSGGTWMIPRLVGLARARKMILLGREVSGDEAESWGLIHQAVPDDALEAAGESLLTELANAPTIAFGLAKFCLHRSLELPLDQAMELEALALELSSRSGDFKEGLRAFQSRTDPNFEGR
ncbi:MAG: enoyl-CoA hydratase/isomerase family protein [Acidimicrobiales bacterium]